jgi:hypothetical protein
MNNDNDSFNDGTVFRREGELTAIHGVVNCLQMRCEPPLLPFGAMPYVVFFHIRHCVREVLGEGPYSADMSLVWNVINPLDLYRGEQTYRIL